MAIAVAISFPLGGPLNVPGTQPPPTASGIPVLRCYEITGDTSYPTGGTAINAATFGITTILDIIPLGHQGNNPANMPVYAWDRTNNKLKAFGTAAGVSGLTEIANATNLSGSSVYLLVNGVA